MQSIHKEILTYSYFFFDFDGVIINSENIKTEAFTQIYWSYGEEVMTKVVKHHLAHGGTSRYEKFRYYHKNYLKREITESELVTLVNRFSTLVFEATINVPFIKGAFEFLNFLKQKEKKMFVISSMPEEEIKKIISLRKLDDYFLEVNGTPLKKADNLRCIIEKYSMFTSQCVYFGDSQEDCDAAYLYKINFVPINYYNGERGYKNFTVLMNGYQNVL